MRPDYLKKRKKNPKVSMKSSGLIKSQTLNDNLTKLFAGCGDLPPQDVTKQSHYMQHKIQPIEFIQLNNLGWCAGNIIKYVCRENLKGGLKDLEKARVYLDCLIHYKKTGAFLTPDKLTKKG